MKLAVAVTIFAVCCAVQAAAEEDIADLAHIVTLGTRPYYILDEMKPSDLKEKLRELLHYLYEFQLHIVVLNSLSYALIII